MSTRDELEASLRARPDDATLAVYADFLQAQGDPRGELIALDLTPPAMSTSSLVVRRGQLLEKWLGDDLDFLFDHEQQLWYAGDLSTSYATFDCGFIDLVVADSGDMSIAKLLGASASAYLRSLSLAGSRARLDPALDALASRSRPWLQRLSISRPTDEQALLLSAARSAVLARATPNLEVLDLSGRNLMSQFAHQTLRELVVTNDAIDLASGPPCPMVHTLDYAFGDQSPPRGLVARERLPALRRIDFSREEPGGVRLYDVLGTLDVAGQLTHLVLPAIRTEDDHALVQAAIDRMPLLREIQLARHYACHGVTRELRHPWARMVLPVPLPWPPRETIRNAIMIDGYRTNLTDIVATLEAHHLELSDVDHAIWTRFWSTVDNLEVSENHPYYIVSEQAFSAADLAAALAALPLDSHLAGLHEHLRARLARRAGGYFAAMHWDL